MRALALATFLLGAGGVPVEEISLVCISIQLWNRWFQPILLSVAGADVDADSRNSCVSKVGEPAFLFRSSRNSLVELGWIRARTSPRCSSACDGKRGLFLARGKFRTGRSGGAPPIERRDSIQLQKLPLVRQRARRRRFVERLDRGRRTSSRRSLTHRPARRIVGCRQALTDLLRTLPASDQIYAALSGGLEELTRRLPQSGNFANFRSVDSAAALDVDLKQRNPG